MTTTTARLGLIKPTDPDPFVTEDIAANWQAIDDAVAGWLPAAPLADRPSASASLAGFLFWAHDEGLSYICVDVGDGTYEWRVTGVVDHAALDNLDDPDAHSQYLLKDDHTKAVHDAMALDAATLDGVSLEALVDGRLIAFESGATFVATQLSTSYTRVYAHQIQVPEEWQTMRLSAYGYGAFDGGHSTAEAHARIQFSPYDHPVSNGPATEISGGTRNLPSMAAHSASAIPNPFHTGGQSQVGVYLECKDPNTSSPSTIESAFLFAMATRES